MSRTLPVRATFVAVVLAILGACAPRGPRAIAYDAEPCDFCRMTISDARFGAEVLTGTGKQHAFDSIECLASFVAAGAPRDVRGAWVSDWNHPGTFLAVDSADFRHLVGPAGSPMGKGFVATARGQVPNGVPDPGPALRWSEVLAAVRVDVADEVARAR